MAEPNQQSWQTENDLHSYFNWTLLKMANVAPSFPMPNPNIRNEAYYAARNAEQLNVINPDTHCVHCGHALEDPDY